MWNICKDEKLLLPDDFDFAGSLIWVSFSSCCLFRLLCPFLLPIQCRGTWHTIRDHVQRSYLIVWDTEPDQLCVPASIFHCLWRPAKPSTGMSTQFSFLSCTVVAIWNYFRSSMNGSAASEPSSEQGRRKFTSH